MKKNIIFLLLIIILITFTWYKIYFHSFQGEGYYFFDPTLNLPCIADSSIKVDNDFFTLCRYDNLGRLIYYLFKNIFFDNLKPYLLFIIFIQIIISFCIFFLTKKITKNKFIAFLAAIFFGINYMTNFEMISTGNYQWFATRVPNFVLTLVSIIFYYQFLTIKKYYYYLLSLLIFLLSVLIAHVSMFLLPFIIFLGFFHSIFKCSLKKELILNGLLLTPFIIGTMFIISNDSFSNMDGGFMGYLFRYNFEILKEILFQLTMITIPYDILTLMVNVLIRIFFFSSKTSIEVLYVPVFVFYLFSMLMVFRFNKQWGIFLLTCFLSILVIGIFNLYTNRAAFIYQVTNSRYYFPLGFLVSIYLAIVLYVILWKGSIIKRIFLIFFMVFWIYSNINIIWLTNNENQYKHTISHNIRNYVKNISFSFKNDSLIVLPKETGVHEASFLKFFYGKETMSFVSFVVLTDKEAKSFNPKKDFLIVYDNKEKKAINLTDQYQNIFKKDNLIK